MGYNRLALWLLRISGRVGGNDGRGFSPKRLAPAWQSGWRESEAAQGLATPWLADGSVKAARAARIAGQIGYDEVGQYDGFSMSLRGAVHRKQGGPCRSSFWWMSEVRGKRTKRDDAFFHADSRMFRASLAAEFLCPLHRSLRSFHAGIGGFRCAVSIAIARAKVAWLLDGFAARCDMRPSKGAKNVGKSQFR